MDDKSKNERDREIEKSCDIVEVPSSMMVVYK